MATRSWDSTQPPETQKFKLGATRIRETREDVDERASIDHYWHTDKTYDGESKKTTYRDQTSAPGTVAGKSFIYAKNDGSYSLPYMKDGQGNVSSLGMPVGSIVAWLPGYFTAAANVGYTGVDINLPSNWKVCDGSALSDSDSPIWNAAGRYLPDIDDARFLAGNSVDRGVAGNSSATITQPAFTGPNHNHKWYNYTTSEAADQSYNSEGNIVTFTATLNSYLKIVLAGDASGAKFNTDYYTSTAGAGACGRTVDVALSNIIPKYLNCSYIIKVK